MRVKSLLVVFEGFSTWKRLLEVQSSSRGILFWSIMMWMMLMLMIQHQKRDPRVIHFCYLLLATPLFSAVIILMVMWCQFGWGLPVLLSLLSPSASLWWLFKTGEDWFPSIPFNLLFFLLSPGVKSTVSQSIFYLTIRVRCIKTSHHPHMAW